MNLKRFIPPLLIVLVPLLLIGRVYRVQAENDRYPGSDIHWLELKEKIKYQTDHFPGKAGIFVKDLKNGWTIEYSSDEKFPSASLIKIPIMIALYHAQSKGSISLDQILTIQRKQRSRGSGSLKRKRIGTALSIRNLIYKMIAESDNTATNMLTDLLGIEYYGQFFKDVGLKETNFDRMIMDLKRRDLGIENYTTPAEMGYLLEQIYKKQFSGSDEMLAILKSQKINDRLAVPIPATWSIGHKTGLMNRTCHDVGIVFSPSGDYIVCVLTSDIRNIRRAKNFISEIAHITTLYYGNPSIHPARKRFTWLKGWSQTFVSKA